MAGIMGLVAQELRALVKRSRGRKEALGTVPDNVIIIAVTVERLRDTILAVPEISTLDPSMALTMKKLAEEIVQQAARCDRPNFESSLLVISEYIKGFLLVQGDDAG